MNCRSGKDHHRAQLYWHPSENGSTYMATEPTYPTAFTDPGCQGSILNANGTLFTSNAASTTARERMTIHRSDDSGASWSSGQVIHSGPSAYSQLVELQAGKGGQLGVLFEAGTHSAYDTISFAAFDWTPPKQRRHWTHQHDGSLTTDGVYCLDWTIHGLQAYMSPCNPAQYPHQIWSFTTDGHLVSQGSNVGNLVLDWTSRVNADGGHSVYMHESSTTLPHQKWRLRGSMLDSDGADGLCLDWITSSDGKRMAEMRTCEGL